MKIVLIHGRAQGGRSSQQILEQWVPGLKAGMHAAGLMLDPSIPIVAPFYGDVLDSMSEQAIRFRPEVVTRGTPPSGDVDEVTAAMIEQMAIRAGLDIDQVLDGENVSVVERGPERWGWVQALARRLEAKYPWLARTVIGKVTSDVKSYIDFPHIQDAVHDIVVPALRDGPTVIVSHSLGTVIAYWSLVEHVPNADVPLLITAGSPLGLNTIKKRLPQPLRMPHGVQRWLNVTDQEDIVALHARLDQDTFIPGIENVDDVENGDDPHAIERYLSDPRVARAIHAAL
ncbi:MAG: hypothetical protein LW720_11510 [Pirellula sp.]|nr:hypothetical protein [Pirellula sp.]